MKNSGLCRPAKFQSLNIHQILKLAKDEIIHMRCCDVRLIRLKEDFIPACNIDHNYLKIVHKICHLYCNIYVTRIAKESQFEQICISALFQCQIICVIDRKNSLNWYFKWMAKIGGDHHIWNKWIRTNLSERYFNKVKLPLEWSYRRTNMLRRLQNIPDHIFEKTLNT